MSSQHLRDLAIAKIQNQLAKPLTHAVITNYADGTSLIHKTRCFKSASNHAEFIAKPKIGRTLINRETNTKCTVTSVEIKTL